MTSTPPPATSSAASTAASVDLEDDVTKPLWAYTTKDVTKRSRAGGNMTRMCNLCMRESSQVHILE